MGDIAFIWKFWWAILLISLQLKNAESGLPTLLRRWVREVYPEIESDNYGSLTETDVCILGDVVYSAGEVVPAEEPCLRCKCQPPGVHCETIKCAKKTGCRSVQHPNKCCPDYQCECDHENRTYANGERLKTLPDGECKVCYCRGGEIQCTEVSCYIRSDCEAKRVPGQCCPKYDHCPLKDFIKNTSNNNKEETTINKPEEDDTKSVKHEDSEVAREEFSSRSVEIDSVELEESQQPPSILKIGNKLLFLKRGELVPESEFSTETSVITIIGAEGLQRGFEESAESSENNTQNFLFTNSNDLEPKVAESTHILSLVKHKQKPNEEKKEFVETTTLSENEEEQELDSTTVEASTVDSETTTIDSEFSTDLPPTTYRSEELKLTPEETETEVTTEKTEENEELMAVETIPTADKHSVESIEDTSEESGENTTPKDNYASADNASVETIENDEYETHDMMHSLAASAESEIDEVMQNRSNNQNADSRFVEDVELISVNKTILKRESSPKHEADHVFRELEVELNVDSTERAQSTEEEEIESDKIFQELINETSTTKPVKKNDKEAETVNRITDAVANFAFRGRKDSDGTNILGLLSDLFNFRLDGRKRK